VKYEIEKIELGQYAGKGRSWDRFPFADLEVGQCFLVPRGPEEYNARQAAVKYKRFQATGRKGTVAGWDYTTRTVPEGVRIWRTA